MSIVQAKIGCTHDDAPLCHGHKAKCAKRKVDKPSSEGTAMSTGCATKGCDWAGCRELRVLSMESSISPRCR